MDVCDFGKKKNPQIFLFSISCKSPYILFLFCNLRSHSFARIWLQHLGFGKIRTLSSAGQPCFYPVSQTHKWHTLAFCFTWSPKKKKDIEGEDGTRRSQAHHFYSTSTCSSAGMGLFWEMKPSPAPAVACPSVAGVTLPWNTCLSSTGNQIQSWCKEWLQDKVFRICFVSYQASSII